MRITDVVTPQELNEIFNREIRDIISFGQRVDLKQKYVDDLKDRIADSYAVTVLRYVSDIHQFAGIMRILALLDRFLEEKYANSSHTAD